MLEEFNVPGDIASCPHCRSIVGIARYVDGRLFLWDPRFQTRRWLVSSIGIAVWIDWLDAGQGWGRHYDAVHECPPAELRLLREGPGHDVLRN